MSYIGKPLKPRDLPFPAASTPSPGAGPMLFAYDDNLIFENETLGKRIREEEPPYQRD